MNISTLAAGAAIALSLLACAPASKPAAASGTTAQAANGEGSGGGEASGRHRYYSRTDTAHLSVSNAEWKKILPDELYEVAREAATERAFSGKYLEGNPKGSYYCAVCGNALFRSDAKFSSHCGWPSFFEPLRAGSVRYEEDKSYGMERIEVLCARCDSHLGHIFDDGPPPTGKRYCMNSVSLDFEPDGGAK